CAAWEAALLPLNYTREEIPDFRLSICDLQAPTITARKSRRRRLFPSFYPLPAPEHSATVYRSQTTRRSPLFGVGLLPHSACKDWRRYYRNRHQSRRCKVCPMDRKIDLVRSQ